MESLNRLKKVFARVLNVDEHSVNESTSFEGVPAWDSFNHLKLVSEIEKEFGVEFDVDEISSMENFGIIVDMLKKRGVMK